MEKIEQTLIGKRKETYFLTEHGYITKERDFNFVFNEEEIDIYKEVS